MNIDNAVIGIYEILNTVNGYRYIGSSVDVMQRFATHKSLLNNGKHYNNYLQNAWNKYGEDEFVFSVLMKCTKERLLEWEQLFIDKCEHQYNIEMNVDSEIIENRKMIVEERRKTEKINLIQAKTFLDERFNGIFQE